MSLDSATNRWRVNICPLLMASNPQLFETNPVTERGSTGESIAPDTGDCDTEGIQPPVNQSSWGTLDSEKSASCIPNPRSGQDSAVPQRRLETLCPGPSAFPNVQQPVNTPKVLNASGVPNSGNGELAMSINSSSSTQEGSNAVPGGSKGSSNVPSNQVANNNNNNSGTAGSTPPASNPSGAEEPWWMKLKALAPAPEEQRVVVWSGILARNDKKKTPATLRKLCGPIEQFLPTDGFLSISHRSAYEELSKKDLGAIGIMESASPDSVKLFYEYIQYFHEKNRAGVVRIEKNEFEMIYLMPGNAAGVTNALGELLPKNADEILLAVVGRACRNAPV